MADPAVPGSRLERRKAQTRAALVAAARDLLRTRDPAEVSIQEITDAADVGFGSFYNHFSAKQDLFDAAMDEVLEEHGAMLDDLTSGIEDPRRSSPSRCASPPGSPPPTRSWRRSWRAAAPAT